MRLTSAIVVPLCLLLGISGPCYGQSKLTFHEAGKHRAQVRITGAISLQDDPSQPIRYSQSVEGFLSNVSTKDIVSTVVHFAVNWENLRGDYDYKMDRFFGQLLQAGGSEKIEDSPIPLVEPTVGGEPSPQQAGRHRRPKATAEVASLNLQTGQDGAMQKRGLLPCIYGSCLCRNCIGWRKCLMRTARSNSPVSSRNQLQAFSFRRSVLWPMHANLKLLPA